jgi:hypothetical protein
MTFLLSSFLFSNPEDDEEVEVVVVDTLLLLLAFWLLETDSSEFTTDTPSLCKRRNRI